MAYVLRGRTATSVAALCLVALAAIPSAAARSSATLADLRTIFVDSKTGYVHSSLLEERMQERPEFARLGLAITRDRDTADAVLEVERSAFTTKFNYSLLDPRTHTVLASGRVNSLFGTAAGKIAKMLMKQLVGLRVPAAASAVPAKAPSSRAGRETWTDPSTGLTWAARDNGEDVSWKAAEKYCRNLRTAGRSDWRLATIEELDGIYDAQADSPGLAGKTVCTWHVKGNLFLTGPPWSGNYVQDARGRNSGYSRFYDFGDGRADRDPSGWGYPSSKRALCVCGN